MNPIVLSLADGTSFFIGLGVVLIAGLLLLRFHNGLIRPILTVLVIIGMILAVISATPLPVWAYVVWLIPAIAALVLGNLSKSSSLLRVIVGGLLCAATAGLSLTEAPFHCLPRVIVPKGKTVYVLGDSISAGIGTTHRCWPTVLKDITGFSVVNLAEPGATVQSACKQAMGIMESNSIVIVEIGGNDLLGGTDATAFRDQLAALISSLSSNQHQVLMVELPLFPFQNAFGKAQRNIAAKNGVAMLPKWCFTKVMGTTKGTLDGLHLSQEGHNAMAQIIAGVLQKE